MAALRRLVARLYAYFDRRRQDTDFASEIETHVAMLADEYVRRGMRRPDAERAARLRFGSPAALEARHRDVRGLPVLDAFAQDLRFALRLTLKDRWFSVTAIAVLAIGIGANAAGFSVISAAFLRGLPFADSHAISQVSWRTSSNGTRSVSALDIAAWQDDARTITLAALDEGPITVSDSRLAAERVSGARVTANLFGVLGQPLLLGRDFVAGEDTAGADPVVIISHRLWTARYAADPEVLGRAVRIDGHPATIVGVMPEGMMFPETAQVWVPLALTADQRASRFVTGIGRLASGVSRREAEHELSVLAERFARERGDAPAGQTARVERFGIGGYAVAMFITVMAAVGLVLLIACANVANLLLSRSVFRAREIAVRIAVGATRARVVRQLLVESLVLAVAGGAVGLMLASVAVDVFERAMAVSAKPYWLTFSVDGYVVAYVIAIGAVTVGLFGLMPALHVSSAKTQDVLKDGGWNASSSRRVTRFSGTMVIVELALTVVLLAGAGLLLRSFAALYTVDLGISTANLLGMRLDLAGEPADTAAARWARLERLRARVAGVPGVEAAALTTGVPPHDDGERLMEVETTAPAAARFVSTVTISPEFFATVSRPLLRGRPFDAGDGRSSERAVIVNERLAAMFFPGQEAIGRRLASSGATPAAAIRPRHGARSSASARISGTARQTTPISAPSSICPTRKMRPRPPPCWCAARSLPPPS